MKTLKLFNNTKIDVYDDEVEKIINGIKEKTNYYSEKWSF